MSRDLETVLADRREDANAARRLKDTRMADVIDAFADEVQAAAEDWLVWKSLADARLRSGKGKDFFRRRYADWSAQGHAKRIGRVMYFRQCVIPVRANVSAARDAGRRGERRAS